MANNGKITRGMEAAIAALLATPSVPEAAKQAGIADRTLYRWLQDEGFKAAYSEARRAVVQQATVEIQATMTKAVATLRAVMDDEGAPASARVSAARAVLDFGVKVGEIEELQDRIDRLERRVRERENVDGDDG